MCSEATTEVSMRRAELSKSASLPSIQAMGQSGTYLGNLLIWRVTLFDLNSATFRLVITSGVLGVMGETVPSGDYSSHSPGIAVCSSQDPAMLSKFRGSRRSMLFCNSRTTDLPSVIPF